MVQFTLLEVNLGAGSIPSLGFGDGDATIPSDSSADVVADEEHDGEGFGPDPRVLVLGGLAFAVAVTAIAWRVLGSDVGPEAIDDAVPAPLDDDADTESLDEEI